MNVIIKIQERDAIPVRALPFVAGFEQFSLAQILSPYWIAMSAAMPNDPGIGNSLATFTIENGEIRQLAPNEWGAIIEQTDKPLNDAVRELPSGVFVFADDFTKWFKWLRCSTNETSDLDSLLATRGVTVPAGESPNLNPLVPDLLNDIVLEGFEAAPLVIEDAPLEHGSKRIHRELDPLEFEKPDVTITRPQPQIQFSQPINLVEPRPTATTPLHDKQRRQEQAIVDELKMLGYNPKAFPKSRNGASGVRSEVRDRFVIGEGELFGTINTFRLAWERAKLMGDIKSAE